MTVFQRAKVGGYQFGIPHSDDGISYSEGVQAQIEPTYSDDSFHPEYGGTQETVLYSRKGVMEICRWSRQPKADAFMDFVWEVTDRLMSGEVVLAPGNGAAVVPTGDVCAQLDSIAGALAALDEKVSKVQTASSFSNYYLRCQMRSGYDERWERSQHPLWHLSGFVRERLQTNEGGHIVLHAVCDLLQPHPAGDVHRRG